LSAALGLPEYEVVFVEDDSADGTDEFVEEQLQVFDSDQAVELEASTD